MNDPSKTQPPEWAVAFARGAHRIGMPVPEIEQHLVSRGLAPDEANRIVMAIVEGDLQQQTPLAPAERGKPMRLFVSAAIGAACLFLAYRFGGGMSLGRAIVVVFSLVGFIWIPEVTDTVDSDWGMRWWVCGWLLLLLYFGYRIFLWAMVH